MRSVILRTCVRSPPAAVMLLISTGKTSGNLRKISGKLRKIFGLFRRWRKNTDIQLFFCSLQTGKIFRSMDSLVLRHPIICTEFNVRSFHSVSTTPVVHLEPRISPRIFEKIQNGRNGILSCLGETDS
jgi:hypothetical protein